MISRNILLKTLLLGATVTRELGITWLARVVRLVAIFGLLVGLTVPSVRADQAQQQGAWGAAVGVDPCGSEVLLEQRLAQDPTLREKLELFERLVQEATQKGLLPKSVAPGSVPSGTPIYVIPVAVHIVHQNGPENISDPQVLSQIEALNRDCQDLLGLGLPAVDTRIQFCLATNLPPGSSVHWSTTPGITRCVSSETNTIFGSTASQTALMAIDYLPADRYLNIWVVKSISGGNGGIVGYATLPGTGPLTLDGIVMRYDVFGSNSYGSFDLLHDNDDGKILTHEVGHYLNLFHTFHLGCTGFNTLCNAQGDCVPDTPPEDHNNVGCPSPAPVTCTPSPDPIENFMDYTNDPCRWAFTNDQTTRMHIAIGTYRSLLVSAENLIFTGCPSGLNALIDASPTQVCVGGMVEFDTPAYGYMYDWMFPDGIPPTANTKDASSYFTAAGPHTVTLTVTDGSGNFSTNTTTIYVIDCTPITGMCANWVFGNNCRLDFATGLPVAVNGTQSTSLEAAAQISDNAGNLLFYSDADYVWDRNNNVMPNGTGIFGGSSSHNGAIIVPRPGSSTQYFLFTVSQQENGDVNYPVRVTTVDMTLNGGNGDVVTGQKNIPVNLPGSPQAMLEGQVLIPHCNGVDWWYITHGAGGSSGKIFVTLVTSAGPLSSSAFAIGMTVGTSSGDRAGAISPSPDGSKFATCGFFSYQLAVYDFNRTTGVPTTVVGPTNYGKVRDVCFSPNGKLLYYSVESELRQMEIATLQQRTVGMIPYGFCFDIELGPDGKVYVSMAGQKAIGCINFPDNFNTFDANECGYNPSSIPLGSGIDADFGPLPNTIQMCNPATQPAQFTYTVTNCVIVSFHAVNCSDSYSWDFGDGNSGAGQDVVHTYANPGTYTVTLTVSGASPPQQTQTLVLEVPTVAIAGPLQACVNPSNYSASAPPGCSYQWIISGGNPPTATGDNVDVSWGPAGGTVTLVVTDPTTGCTSQQSITVAGCCVAAPADMVAWWPLDEQDGATIVEDIAVADYHLGTPAPGPVGSGGGPSPVGGKVGGALNFWDQDVGRFVRVTDHPDIRFGTTDFSIDAWVFINQYNATDLQPIVEKMQYDGTTPEYGYRFYLESGVLSFTLAWGPGTATTAQTSSPLTTDVWHHVAVTVDRDPVYGDPTVILYIDGTFAYGVTLLSTTSIANTEDLIIGGSLLGASIDYFDISIDEVELFDRALTDDEVFSIFVADYLGKCKGYLSGMKFHDHNGNGIQESYDLGLDNWTIFIDTDGGHVLDQGETYTTTNALGYYSFTVPPGQYTICEVNQSGWTQKFPAGDACHSVTVSRNQNVTCLDFGNYGCEPCPDNVVENWSFTPGFAPWLVAYGTPDIESGTAWCDLGKVSMEGNQYYGEAIYQILASPFDDDWCYAIKFDAIWVPYPGQHDPVQFEFRASTRKLLSATDCPTGDCERIGVSEPVTPANTWMLMPTIIWRPTKDGYSYLTVSATTQLSHPDSTSHGAIDRICIHKYMLGDLNGDGLIDVDDVIYLINYLYTGGPPPLPLEAGDYNDDGVLDLGDVVYLINYLYRGGPPPAHC